MSLIPIFIGVMMAFPLSVYVHIKYIRKRVLDTGLFHFIVAIFTQEVWHDYRNCFSVPRFSRST